MGKIPSKAERISEFARGSIFSIAELTEICRMLDMDVDATFKIALHAEFLKMTMVELTDQLFSYGNN